MTRDYISKDLKKLLNIVVSDVERQKVKPIYPDLFSLSSMVSNVVLCKRQNGEKYMCELCSINKRNKCYKEAEKKKKKIELRKNLMSLTKVELVEMKMSELWMIAGLLGLKFKIGSKITKAWMIKSILDKINYKKGGV